MGVRTEHHPATVTDTDDPEKRGRIKVACAALLGDEDSPLPMWVTPVGQWGWFIVPDVGEIVEVEVVTGSSEDEQPGQMAIDNLDIQWRGQRHYGNEEGDAPTPVPDDFTATNYGKRRGFATPGGHVFLFDDTEGEQKVSLTWHQDGKYSFISFDKTGSLILSTHSKHLIQLDAESGEIKVWDQHGNMYVSNEDHVLVFQKDSNSVELDSNGNITVLAQSGVTVNGKVAHLNAGEVILGEGLATTITEFAVLGTALVAWLSTHVHNSAAPGSPTTPPVVPPTGILSTTVKVK